MNKYNIGDRVRVKEPEFDSCHITSTMLSFVNKEVEINWVNVGSDEKDYYKIKEDSRWHWKESDFEEIVRDFLEDEDVLL